MLRASRIPPLLSRIIGDGIDGAMLLTSDGELLGSSFLEDNPVNDHNGHENLPGSNPLDKASMGALIAEVAGDYVRAGRELLVSSSISTSSVYMGNAGDNNNNNNRDNNGNRVKNSQRKGCNLDCLIVELELGRLIGVACCFPSQDEVYFVAATGDSKIVGHGLLRARILALEGYIRESLVQITAYSNGRSTEVSA